MKSYLDKFKTIKFRAIKTVVKEIKVQFGKDSIVKLGSDPIQKIPTISSGSILLDNALGIGGFPKGRVIEIFGPESSGKTTLALHAIANIQKQGGIAAFIDAEHALDISYAKNLEIDCNELLIAQPETGEQALEIVDMLLKSKAIDMIVIDSVAALVPKEEIESEMGNSHKGLQARLMSQAMRKLSSNIHKTMSSIIFTNQIRMTLRKKTNNPLEITSGGIALKFYATIRLDIRCIGTIKDKNNVSIGNRILATVVKNKMAPPFKKAKFEIIYGRGISQTSELFDLGIRTNIIKKIGLWYSFKNEHLGQNKQKVKFFLKKHNDVFEEIKKNIKHYLKNNALKY